MQRKEWCSGVKRWVPRARGRVGHSRRLGSSMSRETTARVVRQQEKKIRQEAKKFLDEQSRVVRQSEEKIRQGARKFLDDQSTAR